jgi:hypothetical protein
VELPSLSERAKEEAAAMIAAKLLQMVDGRIEDTAAWRRVAETLGCRVHAYDVPGGAYGEYVPTEAERIGIIAYNTAYDDVTQCRVLVHEIAHHELHQWIPPQLAFAADVCSYSDHPDDVHHQIARMVERIVLGLGD